MLFPDILMAAATSGGGFDGDVMLWQAAVVANGGTVSGGRLALMSQFVSAEKASGAWALTDEYWFLTAEGSVQALTSLKQRRLAEVTAAPTFGVDTGYVFNGTTQYIDTGFIPSSHSVAMTGSNVRVTVYERTNVSSNTNALGCASSAIRPISIRPRSVTTLNAGCACALTAFTIAADSRGLSAVSRNDAGATPPLNLWKNGVFGSTVAAAASSNTAPTVSLWIGGSNVSGVLTLPRACTVGFASLGALLTDPQEASTYANVQAFMTAIGANV